jgi:hypothetical protein
MSGPKKKPDVAQTSRAARAAWTAPSGPRSVVRPLLVVAAIVGLSLSGFAASALAIKGGHVPVTICHKPGTPAEHTITVDQSAVAAHLAHGDYLGPCYSGTTTDPPGTTSTGTITDDPPATTTSPPDPPAPTTTAAGGASSTTQPVARGDLPYTGVPVWVMFLAGIAGLILGALLLLWGGRAR